MKANLHFSCIIPFYNEGNRVLGVLSEISKVKLITQIICVDDGSTDDISTLIKKLLPNVVVIRLSNNRGKAEAVFEGLGKAAHQNILLLDGDLQNIIPSEIENALRLYCEDQSIDMIILKVKGDNLIIDSLLRKYIFQGGNRILKKSDLMKIVKLKPMGYQLEVATNQYMMDNHKRVLWTNCSAFNLHKTHKYLYTTGLTRDFQMDVSIISHLGIINYLKQMLLFCRNKLPAKEVKKLSPKWCHPDP